MREKQQLAEQKKTGGNNNNNNHPPNGGATGGGAATAVHWRYKLDIFLFFFIKFCFFHEQTGEFYSMSIGFAW